MRKWTTAAGVAFALAAAQSLAQGGGDVTIACQVEAPTGRHVQGYVLQNGEELSILPDNKALMAAWKTSGPISGNVMDFQNAVEYPPAVLDVAVRAGQKPLDVRRLRLEIEESQSDLQPLFVSWHNWIFPGCHGSSYDPKVAFLNFGWSAPTAARVEFAFEGDPGTASPTLTEPLKLTPGRAIWHDFGPALAKVGARTSDLKQMAEWTHPDLAVGPRYLFDDDAEYEQYLKSLDKKVGRDKLKCLPSDSQDACLDKLRKSGVLGKAGAAVQFMDEGVLQTWVAGKLIFEWKDAKGATHQYAAPFKQRVYLGMRWGLSCSGASSGKGPEFDPRAMMLVDFKLDRGGYTHDLPFKGVVAPGQTQRFKLVLRSPKSSQHRFKIAFDTANGETIRSKPLNLQTFLPPFGARQWEERERCLRLRDGVCKPLP